MRGDARRAKPRWRSAFPVVLVAAVVAAFSAGASQAGPTQKGPKFTEAVAFDVSKPFRELAKRTGDGALPPATGKDTDSEPSAVNGGTNALFSPLAAITVSTALNEQAASAIPAPIANFEGLSNQDNFNVFGFRVNPPDPVGDVGPEPLRRDDQPGLRASTTRPGTLLLGPVDTGTLWAGFADRRLHRSSGDPIVVYDQFADRWILTQFTTRGLDFPEP